MLPHVNVPDGFKETEIGPISVDWEVVPLRAVTEKRETRNPRKTPDETFKYIDVSSVSNETYRVQSWKEYRGHEAPSRARKVVEARDTIFATVRPYLRNIAQVPSHLDNEICSTGFCVIRAKPGKADPDYLFYVALSDAFVARIVAQQRGSSYPAVSDKVVLGELIPLPPLPEQHRIAHVLSTIQRAIAAQDDLIAAAREVKRSLMQRLFTYGPGPEPTPTKETEVGEVPEHWEVVRFQDWTTLVTKGSSPKWQGFDYCKEGVAFVRSQNVRLGILDLTDMAYLPEEFNQKHRTSMIRKDDLLINIVGASIGRAALADERLEGANLNQAVALVRLKKDVDPRFAMHFLLTESGLHQIHRQKKEIARANVSLQDIKNFFLPFAPLQEQREITHILQTTDRKIEAEEQRKAALQELFKSTLHQLMTGQVRVRELVEVPQ